MNFKAGWSILLFVFLIGSGCFDTGSQGKHLYQAYCASCHMDDGSGLAALYPPLANSDYLMKYQDKLPCIIRYGLNETIQVNGVTYDVPMEGIKELSDVEIHNIIRYINQAWNNDIALPTFKDSKLRLQQCN